MTEIAVEAAQTPAQLPNVRVAVLGAGKMGGILVQAFLKAEPLCSRPDSRHDGARREGFVAQRAVGHRRQHR